MEFVKINEKSIKIELTKTEAIKYELNSAVSLEPEKSKAVFSQMLAEAKKEIGFHYAGERIVAEIFDSRDGGCEIFISCISGDKTMYKDAGEEVLLSKLKLQNQVFCFDDIDSLLEGCYLLMQLDCEKNTSAYYDRDKNKFYIILEDVSKKDVKFAFLYEISKHVKPNRIEYIKERCTPICNENAHIKLGSLR